MAKAAYCNEWGRWRWGQGGVLGAEHDGRLPFPPRSCWGPRLPGLLVAPGGWGTPWRPCAGPRAPVVLLRHRDRQHGCGEASGSCPEGPWAPRFSGEAHPSVRGGHHPPLSWWWMGHPGDMEPCKREEIRHWLVGLWALQGLGREGRDSDDDDWVMWPQPHCPRLSLVQLFFFLICEQRRLSQIPMNQNKVMDQGRLDLPQENCFNAKMSYYFFPLQIS